MHTARWPLLFLFILVVSCGPQVHGGGSPDGGIPCRRDDDCDGDRYCHDGSCEPFGAAQDNPACGRVAPTGAPSPQVLCEWTGPTTADPFPNHRQVLTTPLVVDFNFDGHRQRQISRPSIVITTYNGTSPDCGLGPSQDGASFGVLRVLDGATCQQQFVLPLHVSGAAQPAVGDVDGDGRPEIVAISASGGVVALRFDPVQGQFSTLWTSHTTDGALIQPFAGQCEWAGPTLADVDDDGHPEVLMEGYALAADGRLLDGALGSLSDPAKLPHVGQFAVVADVDRDGAPDLVTPRALYKWQAGRWSMQRGFAGARGTFEFVALGDLGTVSGAQLMRAQLDGVPEVVVASAGRVWALSREGQMVFGPVTLPGGAGGSAGGGPPVVADFDNDGRAEIGVVGANHLTVLDPDCAVGGTARTCASGRQDGVLWSASSQDSGGATGVAAYDFDGDGGLEAIYADQCYARIYDGRTGVVRYSQPRSAYTFAEYPVVADVQGNFRARLVVPSNTVGQVQCPPVDPGWKGLTCGTAADCPGQLPCDMGYCRCSADAQCNPGGTPPGGMACLQPPPGVSGAGNTCQAVYTGGRAGVRVMADVLDGWVGARPVWNQHAYSVTNVNDDGTVPRTSAWLRNWTQPGLNSFRATVAAQGAPQQPAPDATAQRGVAVQCGSSGVMLLAQVCNRGAAPLPAGVGVNFYEAMGLVCAAVTADSIEPGVCAGVSCAWTGTGGVTGVHDLTVVAADNGSGVGAPYECNRDNNSAQFSFTCGG